MKKEKGIEIRTRMEAERETGEKEIRGERRGIHRQGRERRRRENCTEIYCTVLSSPGHNKSHHCNPINIDLYLSRAAVTTFVVYKKRFSPL